MAVYSPGRTSGYTSLSDWLDANRGTLGNEAGAVFTDISGQLDAAKTAADQVAAGALPGVAAQDMPGYNAANDLQTAAQTAANALTTGVSPTQLTKDVPGTGDRSFEAQLVNIAGANPFAAAQTKAKSLSDYLNQATTAAYKPLPPAAPPPPQEVPDSDRIGPALLPANAAPSTPSTDIPPGYTQPRDDEGNPTGPPVPIPPADNPGGALRRARTLNSYLNGR